MKLTGKIILLIGISTTIILAAIFGIMTVRYNHQIENAMLQNARTLYRMVVAVRNWSAHYEGVFVKKKDDSDINPFLEHPILLTQTGDTLVLKNPALITRELSDLSHFYLNDAYFHMSSKRYINPYNKPDDFEFKALTYFETHNDKKEFYGFEYKGGKRYFRYFAPLYTRKSCLSCHARQGYKEGNLRGGISIHLSAEPYEQAKHNNLRFMIFSSILSIFILGTLLYFGLHKTIIRPIETLTHAASQIEAQQYNFSLQPPPRSTYEINKLFTAFDRMKNSITAYLTRLKLSEEKYRTLIENSLEAMAIVNQYGKIVETNTRLAQLLNREKEQLLNKHIDRFFNKKKITPLDENINSAYPTNHYETELLVDDRTAIPVEVFEIRNINLTPDEQITFFYLRDLRLRKKLEHYSLQMEKMLVLGELSAGIAHELRNPLFALTNNLDYLNRQLSDHAAFNEVYPELQESVNNIHRIVSAILDFAAPHPPEFKNVNLIEIIDKCLILVRKKFENANIKIEQQFFGDCFAVRVDPYQIEQVFVNLLMNAFKAMKSHGQLIIKGWCKETVTEIAIQDTGSGIAPENLDRIFDPFFTKFEQGTGLGLSIVQKILTQHRAKIQVQSEVGLGTTFIVSFPKNLKEDQA